jgi:DNA primase
VAEAGSLADRVKQQADIVRVVGEYVRLKKSGQNFMGLCPFHQEKTPSFAVHPVKQIYHCFGCGVGGDVFQFVMEMEKCSFPEAMRAVAEKCGIALPKREGPRASPQEREAYQQRTALVELHREAAAFFTRQLESSAEGRAARAYLEDRGLDEETIRRFGLGYAPSSGDALCQQLRAKYAEKLLEVSGLCARDPSGRLYDRFRRRIMFPIANDAGRVIAFGGRALGDDLPKYMNSPETPIYAKSRVLYGLDRAKEAMRRAGFAVLVEGYMDAIALARAGFENVVASCGTSLAEAQSKLLGRFTRRVVVNYDPDAAGQAAAERSIGLLLEQEFEVRVLLLPEIPASPAGGEGKKADPDLFIRERGAEEYGRALARAPAYLDYLVGRARQMDLRTVEGKLRAVNFLLPHVQRIPSPMARSEWATRMAAELRVDEPMLREALRRAAAERRSEVRPPRELLVPAVRPAERRLLHMLAEAEGFRGRLARELEDSGLYRGLETEPLFSVLVERALADQPVELAALGEKLAEKERRLLFGLAFEPVAEPTWEEAQSCLAALRRRPFEEELLSVQRLIEAEHDPGQRNRLLDRKQELHRLLRGLEGRPGDSER